MFDLQSQPLYVLGSVGLAIIVPSVCGILAWFYKSPEKIVHLGYRYQMHKSGMKKRVIRHGKQVFCYGERNSPKPDKPTLVFIHGFTSSKLQWLPAFRFLRIDSHMIAIDLPGHGDSSAPDPHQTIDLNFLESNLCQFLELAGLGDKKIHLVGASLGGAIAGIFAALHPQRVCKVTMVCPAMKPPVENEFIQSIKNAMNKDSSEITYEDCIFFPEDIQGMKEMFKMCIYHKEFVDINPKIFQGMLNIRRDKYSFFRRMFKETNTSDNLDLLVSLAPTIKMPSQVLWGAHDEIIHNSGAEYLGQKLPDCRHVEIFEKCGHAVDTDRPGAFCKALTKFVKEECK